MVETINEPTPSETITISGGFGPGAINSEVMDFRRRFVEASGWHPQHTVPKSSIEKYPDSDSYDTDPGTLHLSARLGGKVLLACMRITPCNEGGSLSDAMMEQKPYEHVEVDPLSNTSWDITRLVTAYEASQRGVDVADKDINHSIAAAVMMFGAVGGIQQGLLSSKDIKKGVDFFNGERGHDATTSWRFTIDGQVKWLLESCGIKVVVIKEAVINGDENPTILGLVRPYESMANIIEYSPRVPAIDLPTRDVLRKGYESFIGNFSDRAGTSSGLVAA